MKTRNYVTGLFLVAGLALACCGQKAATEDATPATASTDATTMKDTTPFDPTGYTEGVIKETKQEGNCQWVIQLKDGTIYETTDMKKDFMKDGVEVYFTFRGLRRMSMCPGANPVEILEMRMVMG